MERAASPGAGARGGGPPAEPSTSFPPNASTVEREVLLEGREGRGLRATAEEDCEGSSCAVVVPAVAAFVVPDPRVPGPDLASIPYPRAPAIIADLLGPLSDCGAGTVIGDAGKPDFGPGDTFLLRCFAEEPRGGVSNDARVDGLTGLVLEMKGPRARVVGKIGVAP